MQMISHYYQEVGGFDMASMQVNFNTISLENAEASTRLFAEEVMSYFNPTKFDVGN